MIEGLWRVEYESALASYKSEKEQQELREGAWKQLYTAAVKKGNELPLRPDDSIAQPQLRRLITQVRRRRSCTKFCMIILPASL